MHWQHKESNIKRTKRGTAIFLAFMLLCVQFIGQHPTAFAHQATIKEISDKIPETVIQEDPAKTGTVVASDSLNRNNPNHTLPLSESQTDPWTVTSLTPPAETNIQVGFGMNQADLALPSTLVGSLERGADATLEQKNEALTITWECATYNETLPGTYNFIAKLADDTLLADPLLIYPTIVVTVDSITLYDAQIEITFEEILGHPTPTTASLQTAILNGIIPNEQVEIWNQHKGNVIINGTQTGNTFTYTIKNLPKKYGTTALTYTLKPLMSDFLFTPIEAQLTETANTATFTCKPVPMPTVVLANTYHGALPLEEITYIITLANGFTQEEKIIANGSKEILFPLGTTKVTIDVKSDNQLYTWDNATVLLDFETSLVQEATFIHSRYEIETIATINWNDNQNQDSIRPLPQADSYMPTLQAEGLTIVPTPEITYNTTAYNSWSMSYTKLPAYHADGTKIIYSFRAPDQAGYLKETVQEGFTNFSVRYTLEYNFHFSVHWYDNNNQYETRPANIEKEMFTLYQNNDTYPETQYTMEITDSSVSIKGIPAFTEDGIGYLWSIKQKNIDTVPKNTINSITSASYRPNYRNVDNFGLEYRSIYKGGTIYNDLKSFFTFTGTLQWLDDGDSTKRVDGSLTLQRYIAVGGNTIKDAYPVPGKSTIPINTTTSNSIVNFSGLGTLPCFDELGREYVYFAAENLGSKQHKDPYEKLFENQGSFTNITGSGSYLFQNGIIKNRRTDTTNLDITVLFKTAARQSISSSVLVQVQFKKRNESTWHNTGNPKKIGPFFAEQMVMKEQIIVPKYDDLGKQLDYRLFEKEAIIDGNTYDTTSGRFVVDGHQYVLDSQMIGNAITLTHTLEGDHTLLLHKTWASPPANATTIQFKILQDGKTYIDMPTVTMNKGQGDAKYWGSVTIDSLPAYDNNGRAYSYDIREVVPSGYYETYTHMANSQVLTTEVLTTNEIAQLDGKTIVVRKNWLDDGDKLQRKNVTIALYKKGNAIPINTKILTPENNWWGYMAVTGFDSSNGDTIDNYFIRELKIGNEADIVYGSAEATTAQVSTPEQIYTTSVTNDSSKSEFIVSNLRIGVVTVSVDASNWIDGHNLDRPKINLALYKDGILLEHRLIDDTTSYKTEFSNLPKYDASGNIFTYTLTAEYDTAGNKHEDYKLSQTKYAYLVGPQRTNDILSYSFESKKKKTLDDLVINQMWMDDNPEIRPNTQMQLYRTCADGKGEEKVTEVYKVWNTQITKWHWTCGFVGLPKYSDDGFLYTYYVQGELSSTYEYTTYYVLETPVDSQITVEGSTSSGKNSVGVNGTIIYRKETMRDIKGTKTWKNVPGALETSQYPTAKFLLMYFPYKEDSLTDAGMESKQVGENTLDINNQPIFYHIVNGGTTFDFGTLPHYDKLGRTIQYYIKETPIDGFVELTGDVGQFILENIYDTTNGLRGSVLIEKTFTGFITPDTGLYPELTFELWKQLQNFDGNPYGELEKVDSKTIQMTGNTASLRFDDILIFAPNARPFLYTVREKTIDGYTNDISAPEGYLKAVPVPDLSNALNYESLLSIENAYTGGDKRTLSIEKTWTDEENKYDTRPDKIIFHLYRADGTNQVLHKTQEVTAAMDWKHSFTGLETYAPSGKRYTYYIEEEAVPGYVTNKKITVGKDTSNVPVKNTLITTELKVIKEWKIKDQELLAGLSSFGLLPLDMEIGLTLQQKQTSEADTEFKIVKRNALDAIDQLPIIPGAGMAGFKYKNGVYEYTYKKLPKYNKQGNELQYRAWETTLHSTTENITLTTSIGDTTIGPYTTTHNIGAGTVNIVNRLNDVLYLHTQTKWADNDNQDGIRAATVSYTIHGKKGGSAITPYPISIKQPLEAEIVGMTETERKTNWPVTTWMVPEKALDLTVLSYDSENGTAQAPVGYTGAEVTTQNVTIDGNLGSLFEFTFTHLPRTTTLEAEKQWELKSFDVSYKRPVYAKLFVNNIPLVTSPVIELKETTWKNQWTLLPISINTDYISVAAVGEGKLLTYSVAEVNADGSALDENKLLGFLNPVYSNDYQATKEQLTTTTPLSGNLTITNEIETASFTVTEIWEDSDNLYLTRPLEVDLTANSTMQLQQKGTNGIFTNYRTPEVIITKNGASTTSYKWTGLPTYAPDHTLYEYRVIETALGNHTVTNTEDTSVTGIGYNYQVTYKRNTSYEMTVTNAVSIFDNAKATYQVQKTWDDRNDNDLARPQQLKITLFRDDIPVTHTILTKNTNWEYTWTNIPKFKNGATVESVYRVEEEITSLPAGYAQTDVYEDADTHHTIFTNSYSPKAVTLKAQKQWDDQNNKFSTRPKELAVTLQVREKGTTQWKDCEWIHTGYLTEAEFINPQILKANTLGAWEEATWNEVYRFYKGKEMEYQVLEKIVPFGYQSSPAPFTIDFTTVEDTSTLINTLETIDVTVEKIWDDEHDLYSVRDSQVTVQLYKQAQSDPLPMKAEAPIILQGTTLNATIPNLAKYKSGTNEEYTYTMKEILVGTTAPRIISGKEMANGYEIFYSQTKDSSGNFILTVTNKYLLTNHMVETQWIDKENAFSTRPTAIVAQLQRKVSTGTWENFENSKIITNNTTWNNQWTQLPVYSQSNERYLYRVLEIKNGTFMVDSNGFANGYYVTYRFTNDGSKTTLINTLDTINVTGSIQWDDNNNLLKLRPTANQLILQLEKNNVQIANTPTWKGWTYEYKDLPRWFNNGSSMELCEYKVTESIPLGYKANPRLTQGTASKTKPQLDLPSITNTLSVLTITGEHTWQDQNNKWLLRPTKETEIMYIVKANGQEISLEEDQIKWNGWQYEISKLPHYNSFGVKISYSIEMKPLSLYNTTPSVGIVDPTSGNITGMDFNHILPTGDLTLAKTCIDNPKSDLDFMFTIALSIPGKKEFLYRGDYIHTTVNLQTSSKKTKEDGIFLLKEDESITLKDIPAGINYQVSEIALPGFLATSTNANGTIVDSTTSQVTFVNELKEVQLEIKNVTNNPDHIGGMVAVGTSQNDLMLESMNSVTKKLGIVAAFMPNSYWDFGDNLIITWYELGNLQENKCVIKNYLDDKGNLKDIKDPVFDELRSHWSEAKISINKNTITLTLNDRSTYMPCETQIEVYFLPTLAVLNCTENGQGGKVGFSEQTMDELADGVPELDRNNRYKKQSLQATAAKDYTISLDKLQIGHPKSLDNEVGGIPITLDENNSFNLTLPLQAAKKQRSILANSNTITGKVTIVETDEEGNPIDIRIALNSQVPLDIGILFEKKAENVKPLPPAEEEKPDSGGNSNTPLEPDSGGNSNTPLEPDSGGNSNTPLEPDSGNGTTEKTPSVIIPSRNVPKTSDEVSDQMNAYFLVTGLATVLSLFSGILWVNSLQRKRKKKFER